MLKSSCLFHLEPTESSHHDYPCKGRQDHGLLLQLLWAVSTSWTAGQATLVRTKRNSHKFICVELRAFYRINDYGRINNMCLESRTVIFTRFKKKLKREYQININPLEEEKH